MNDPRGRVASASELMDLSRQVQEFAAQNGGKRIQNYKDVRALGPTVAQVDIMEFKCDVSAAGVITQPDSRTVPGNYYAQLAGIRGSMQSPLVDPELASLLSFNVRDESASSDVFSGDVMMSALVDPSGGGAPMEFVDGIYVFQPGSTIKVKFVADADGTVGYATNASAAKRWAVHLRLNLYAK